MNDILSICRASSPSRAAASWSARADTTVWIRAETLVAALEATPGREAFR